MANEKRLIDADGLISRFCELANRLTADNWFHLDAITDEITDAPTVDAVEVVHGRWENIRNFGGGECYGWCSHCKTPVKADNATGLVQNNRFCHWCGANMMDGGNEDGAAQV